MEQVQEVPNVITKGSYEDFAPGEHVVGLVGIKLVEADVWDQGVKTGKKEQKYQLTFRGYENSKAYFNIRMRPVWNEKSTMYQVLRAMSEKKLKISSSPEDAFRFLTSSLGLWFVAELGMSKHGRIALTSNDAIMQCKPGPVDDKATTYFATLDADGNTHGDN
jgi:hypothetical protein